MMFNEDVDWNDEADAQILIKTVQKSAEKAKSNSNVKPKLVGKKSLLRTLQTLGSVPEWKSDERQHDSDSDTEAAPTHTKRKKKRRKRNKTSEKPDAQEENGDVEIKDKTTTQKKQKNKKIWPPRAKTTSVGEKTGEQTTKSGNKPEDADKLSRQQWKNKMKNKRKSKNKYRPNMPDEEVNKAEPAHKQTPKEEITTDSACNNKKTPKKKTEKAPKPQKRKNLEQETDSCGTSQTIQAKKIKNSQSDGSLLDGSERKVGVSNQQEQTPANKQKPEMSRQQILKREQLRRLLQRPQAGQKTETADLKEDEKEDEKEEEAGPEEAGPAVEVKLDRSASLRSRMEQRLDSARFRYINEVLYSSTSGEAKRMFGQDPQAFWVYHRGYTAQVQKWPVNPVDGIIAYIRQKSPSLVVADFGCGDCKIARSVKNKVHSFDLAATCDLVTVCDMANVPLKDCSVDIAVFCLSLMGTNLADFLAEANRVLKMGGVLKIAEVASRFENARNFLNALAKLGFKMTSKDTENTHFYSFDFVKTNDSPENRKKFGLQLRACVYKKR